MDKGDTGARLDIDGASAGPGPTHAAGRSSHPTGKGEVVDGNAGAVRDIENARGLVAVQGDRVTRPGDSRRRIGGICSVRDYFEHFSKEQALFLPELRVANEIVALVKDGAVDQATRENVQSSLRSLLEEHCDGTGWHHFKSLVAEWSENVEAGENSVGPQMVLRRLLTVEDTFLIKGRGLVVVPAPSVTECKGPGNIEVELRLPDGSIKRATLTLTWEFVSPTPTVQHWGCMFKARDKTEVPIGTEVWCDQQIVSQGSKQ